MGLLAFSMASRMELEDSARPAQRWWHFAYHNGHQIKVWGQSMIPSREEDWHACSSYSLRP